jgi:hypothetical protein
MKIPMIVQRGWLFAAVLAAWIAVWLSPLGQRDLPASGQFGDKFGALNALFTGLALAGLWFSYRQQRRTIEKQDAHFVQTAYLNALVARIEGYTVQFQIYGKMEQLQREQDELLHELHDALHRYRQAAGARAVSQAEIAARGYIPTPRPGVGWVDR